MKMEKLLEYGVPGDVIALWKKEEGNTLLPLQECAVKKYGLFSKENMLIQAPTSSGKTFIGEMASLQCALRRKKVVYLVPLKALAEEKYKDFKKKYGEYGLKVIVSTRDHREYDGDLESGDFSIAVVVYEKLSQVLVRRPERLAEIDLVVADELEILSDPERGAGVELLLTRILMAGCRLIGLSAVLGDAARLAEWMGARLVAYDRRPVELRFGVLYEGVFQYRTYNGYDEGEELLHDVAGAGPWEILAANLGVFAGRGESCLVFVKAKHESRWGADYLAAHLGLPAAGDAVKRLRKLEPTRSRDALIEAMQCGVAFHNGDLSPEEREAVEAAYRAGEIQVLVSTSTLAVGLNLPVQNVFIAPEKWRYDQRLGMPWKTPILRGEYENMGGRAGRYGAGHDFGRSILIATSRYDMETLWRRYVEGEREQIQPQLAHDALENHVLRLVASRACKNVTELTALLDRTLSGQWVWREQCTVDELEQRVRTAVNRCLDADMINFGIQEDLEATPLGVAVATKGISIATARELEHWIAESESRKWTPLDLLYCVANTPDGQMYQVMLTAREYEQGAYPTQLKRNMLEEDLDADTPVNRVRASNLQPFFEEVRAMKIALMLHAWTENAPMVKLEEEYQTLAGQLLSAADQASWLIDACAALATARGCDTGFIQRLRRMAARVQRGVTRDLLSLTRFKEAGMTRPMMLSLHDGQLHTADALHGSAMQVLESVMPRTLAKTVKQWAEGRVQALQQGATPSQITSVAQQSAPVQTEVNLRPILVVDDGAPDAIVIDGKRVSVQDKQYRLIRLLAASPGKCVSYESVYEAVWGDSVVESGQMHFQKSKLLKQIGEGAPTRKGLIKTTPKRGFTLNLEPEEVLVMAVA